MEETRLCCLCLQLAMSPPTAGLPISPYVHQTPLSNLHAQWSEVIEIAVLQCLHIHRFPTPSCEFCGEGEGRKHRCRANSSLRGIQMGGAEKAQEKEIKPFLDLQSTLQRY